MIAIGTFIELPGYNFQNFFQGESISWDGGSYSFAGFGYSGSSVDLQGGNIDAQLIFTVNELSLNLAKLAADQRHIVTLSKLSGSTPRPWCLAPISCVTSSWSPAFEHDSNRLGLRLSSPLDAISGDVPRRRLTEKLVGALPSTGQIQLI